MSARLLSWCWYPLCMVGSVIAYLMLQPHLPLAAALYGAISLVGMSVILLQRGFPERAAWQPRWAELRADAAFLLTIQLLLPELLTVLCTLALATTLHAHAASRLWPQAWSVPAQVLLMLLCVDFLRYWLHRACHRLPLLWRLHKVHHSPDILYSLNVGRFHPLEKILHYALDTLPVLVLGVSPEVIAAHYLVYSVNGFFQHSNIELRYGWLNYVVGSAETHRWHHARDPRVADCNFGNTTLLWDLLFGTWYLPARRRIPELGIQDRAYPQDFWAQMAAPFAGLLDPAILWHLKWTAWREGRRLARLARDPAAAQQCVLRHLLRRNRDTAFGREHGFAAIRGHAAYVQAVPVREYEALRPYVEAQLAGTAALTCDPPLRCLRTSGSTGMPKDIPLTAGHLGALRRFQRHAVACQARFCPEAFRGSLLAIHSPAREGVLASGLAYGAASGVVVEGSSRLLLGKLAVPSAVFDLQDCELKYLLLLRLALARRDLSYMATANCSTFLALSRLYRRERERLLGDLRAGGFHRAAALPAGLWESLRPRLGADPLRAAELAALPADARLGELWPGLRLVATWTGGSAGVALAALRRELPPDARVYELGYQASEFRGTVTLGRRTGTGLPTLDTHFFEFVERERWERGEPEFLTLDRLQQGVDYHLIVSTPSGLYRYFMNDLVRVTGFFHRTPLLRFVQKGRGVTSLTGEKLYEAQVLEAAHAVLRERGCAPAFLMMLADEQACAYQLYVELEQGCLPPDLGPPLDAALARLNLEYAAKRGSGRLEAPRLHELKAGSGEAYKRHCVARGQRESQFKGLALAYRSELGFDLRRCLQEH